MINPQLLMMGLLGLLASACQIIPSDPHNANLPIESVCFNIRYGSANDGENSWQHRKQLVVETLRGHNPDLFGLQESLGSQTQFVADAFPDFEFYGPSRRGPSVDGEAAPVFWRRDRFQAQATGTFWLSTAPDEIASVGWDAALPRICSWARLLDRKTGFQFVLANTHFDHVGQVARDRSTLLIASRFPSDRVLLMGDFNSAEASQAMQGLRDAGYQDTFRAIHPNAQDVGTYTGFKDTPRPDKIDHIYLRGSATTISAGIDRSRPNGRWPSDHFPVLATFYWN